MDDSIKLTALEYLVIIIFNALKEGLLWIYYPCLKGKVILICNRAFSMKDEDFEYDVMILCSPRDGEVAEDLEYSLYADSGLSVWFHDYDEEYDEDSVRREIEHHLEVSKILVLLMSPHTFAISEWTVLESYTSLFRDPSDPDRHLVPVLIDETEIPEILRRFNYIDWRVKGNRRRQKGYEELLQICNKFTRREEFFEEVIKPEIIPPLTIFKGHGREISKIETACEGQIIVSAAHDNKIRIWKVGDKYSTASLLGHSDYIYGLAVTQDGKTIVSGSDDMTVRVWDALKGECKIELTGHKAWVRSVAVNSDGTKVVSGSDDRTVRVWDTANGECLHSFEGGHKNWVRCVAMSEEGNCIVSGSVDGIVCFRDLLTGESLLNDSAFVGGVQSVHFLSKYKVLLKNDYSFKIWDILKNEFIEYQGELSELSESVTTHNSDRNYIVFTTGYEIQLMDIERDRVLLVLEGHTEPVSKALITANGKIIVSTSEDQTLRVWDAETGDCLKIVSMKTQSIVTARMTGNDLLIILRGSEKIGIWKLDDIYNSVSRRIREVLYTNAKVLLVGETGTGKSGLAHRLVNDEFVQTISSDGVWASQMKLPYEVNVKGIEREVWLWDFAGQSDYRLIHQLYMDETALAVLVFNPQQENPFEGLSQWDKDIQRASRRPFKKLLVAGRTDRGGLVVSRKSIDDFCSERNFAEYLETSALTGKNCSELRDSIIKNINWEDISYISSPRIFKLLKEQIISLKDEGRVLMRLAEIKQQLEMRLPEEIFTIDELRAVIGLLASPGVIKELEFGGFILLQPEIVNSYASAVVRSVRAHIDEIGCIREDLVLKGNLDYQDIKRLSVLEEEVVLRAMHQMLVARGICLREPSEDGIFLVFPSLFKRERPEIGEHPAPLITYKFTGALDEIYSTLIVRLSHTSVFKKEQLWRFAADFKTQSDKRVGLKMTKRGEGTGEITVYFDTDIPDDTKVSFTRYIHEHLKMKVGDFQRVRHYVCLRCGTPVGNFSVVQKKITQGVKDIVCVDCEARIELWDILEDKFASLESQQLAKRMLKESKVSIDNESKELILIGHAFSIAGEANQIFRPISNSDWGIDGEIEFKDRTGKASGKRVYLQLKSGDSYLTKRKSDNKEIFYIRNERHAEYWQSQAYPVMLVIRTSDGIIRWMDATNYLQTYGVEERQIVFNGEPFTVTNLIHMRDRLFES